MTLKVTSDLYYGICTVDVQERRDGNSAVVVLRTDDTEVYFGGLHASVFLIDLRVRVIMDPDDGDWGNRDWARAKAIAVLGRPDELEQLLLAMAGANRDLGRREGRRALQQDLHKLLGDAR